MPTVSNRPAENRVEGRRPLTTSDLAIIGAGPIGLEAAGRAVLAGLNVVVFEKGQVGHHLSQWGHVRLFSPFRMNHSDWGLELIKAAFPKLPLPHPDSYPTGSEMVETYLKPLSRIPQLSGRILEGIAVRSVGREGLGKHDLLGKPERSHHPFRLLVEQAGRRWIHRSRSVVDASGVYSRPQFMGNGNIAAPGECEAQQAAPDHFHRRLVDVNGDRRSMFAGRRVLLVGGGYSAATTLEALRKLTETAPGTRVSWVNCSVESVPYQRYPDDPFPYRDQIATLANSLARRPPSWLSYLGGSMVDEILSWSPQGPFRVVVDGTRNGGRRRREIEVDEIIAHVGFEPDNSIYRQLQIQECYATSGPIKLAASLLGGSGDCGDQASPDLDLLKNPEPDFFIVGNKSYGTNSTFLIRQGVVQVRLIVDHLANRLKARHRLTPVA